MLAFDRRSFLVGSTSVAALFALSAKTLADTRSSVVQTGFGPVRGTVANGIQTFKGIHYAKPPLGGLRFLPPEKPEIWKDIAATTAYGAPAMQMPSGSAAREPTTDLARSLQSVYPTLAEMKSNSEDCLFLNVWTQGLDDKKRPVMVWMHGGGFAYGSGAWPSYDGTNLAKRGDVVVVTINHRLNAFGYLELADVFGPDYARSGNAGMLDLVAALEWVRDNAVAFGGDPNNVTIFGESGGGAKVSTLMAMPSAKGLFHKAIIESGPGLKGVPRAKATADAKALLAELKVTKAKELEAVPADQIIKAAYAVVAKQMPGEAFRTFSPVVDGDVLPADPFDPVAPAISADIPVMIGTNKDEMVLFMAGEPWFGKLTDAELEARAPMIAGPKAPALLAALRKTYPTYSPSYLMAQVQTTSFMWGGSITLAEHKAAQKRAPVYMYKLAWETPVGNGVFKSPHTLEIPLVFDNVENSRALLGPGADPQKMADQMSATWLAFAKTGNPNNPAIPNWPAYDAATRATMVFDLKSQVVNDPNPEVRQALGV
jgi:para-nitrobenzyl esterase